MDLKILFLPLYSTSLRRRSQRADAFACNLMDKAGYYDQFGYGLGHGVGFAVHESPRVGKLSKDVYQPNMTLTIEPGIYIPGWDGVRIEDLWSFRKTALRF